MNNIPLRNRRGVVVAHALIDEEDYEELNRHRWCKDAYGYAVSAFYVDRKTVNVKMHRLLTNAPKGKDVDHVNRDKLDNRKKNLRVCTRSQNNRNQLARIDNTSGHKGIGWDKSRNKWRAQIKIEGKNKLIGRFTELSEAVEAYSKIAPKVYGQYYPETPCE